MARANHVTREHVYVVGRSRRDGAITLSCKGSWGNVPFPDEAAACRAAAASAGRDPYRIERTSVR